MIEPIDASLHPELAQLEARLLARQGRRDGREIRFRCPVHEDVHPSARWNPVKATWYCDVCRRGGGWRDLVARLERLDAAAGPDAAAGQASADSRTVAGARPAERSGAGREVDGPDGANTARRAAVAGVRQAERGAAGEAADGAGADSGTGGAGGGSGVAATTGAAHGTVSGDTGRRRVLVATYRYTDATGRLLYEVQRYAPKTFCCRRPDGRGGWLWNLQGVGKTLYRLPEVAAAIGRGEMVFLVEGEKDADTLAALGFTATTHPGGAGRWLPVYDEVLRGARVVILPDNDEPGRRHADQVMAALAGAAAEVRRLELPDLPPKGDVSDWVDAARGQGLSPDQLRCRLLDLALAARHDVETRPAGDLGTAVPDAAAGSEAEPPAKPVAPAHRSAAAGTSADRAGAPPAAPAGARPAAPAPPAGPSTVPGGPAGSMAEPASAPVPSGGLAAQAGQAAAGRAAPVTTGHTFRPAGGEDGTGQTGTDGRRPETARLPGSSAAGAKDAAFVPAESAPAAPPAVTWPAEPGEPLPAAAPSGLHGVRLASEIAPRRIDYLWEPYIARRKLTLLDGDPGEGKSWLTAAIAAAGSRGCPLPGLPGRAAFAPFRTLFLCEDEGEDILRPRLDRLGADNSMILVRDALSGDPLDLATPAGAAKLGEILAAYRPGLVVIDPIQAFVGAGTDLYRPNEVRQALIPLLRLAQRYDCALLALRHITKARSARSVYAGQGSIDFSAAARSVLLAGSAPGAPDHHALAQIKSNLGPCGPTLAYRLDPGFAWQGTSPLTAEDLLAAAPAAEDAGAEEEARLFLRSALAGGEPLPARLVLTMAREAGISLRTLKRAKRTEGVRTLRRGFGAGSSWFWSLAEGGGDGGDGGDGRKDGAAVQLQLPEARFEPGSEAPWFDKVNARATATTAAPMRGEARLPSNGAATRTEEARPNCAAAVGTEKAERDSAAAVGTEGAEASSFDTRRARPEDSQRLVGGEDEGGGGARQRAAGGSRPFMGGKGETVSAGPGAPHATRTGGPGLDPARARGEVHPLTDGSHSAHQERPSIRLEDHPDAEEDQAGSEGVHTRTWPPMGTPGPLRAARGAQSGGESMARAATGEPPATVRQAPDAEPLDLEPPEEATAPPGHPPPPRQPAREPSGRAAAAAGPDGDPQSAGEQRERPGQANRGGEPAP